MNRRAALLLLLVSAAACRPGQAASSVSLELPDAVEFGGVFAGKFASASLAVRNSGATAIPVEIVAPPDPFTAAFASTTLQPGETAEIGLRFAPTSAGTFAQPLSIVAGGVTKEVLLRGVGHGCGVKATPAALDAGVVRIGETASAKLTLTNDGVLDDSITLVSGGGLHVSEVAFALPAHASHTVDVELPSVPEGKASASIELTTSGGCAMTVPFTVEVLGELVQRTPAEVSFGFVVPGRTTSKRVHLKNLDTAPVHVAFGASGAPFSVGVASVDLGPGAEEDVAVGFAPTATGPAAGTLTVEAKGRIERSTTVKLTGVGGGPVLEVSPAQLDFGAVAVGGRQQRRLVVKNAGVDVPGTTDDNLRLEDPATGSSAPVLTGTSAAEFKAGVVAASYPASGIPAGGSATVLVELTAASAGAKAATLTVHSNDALAPTATVALSAQAASYPSCALEVAATKLLFGNVDSAPLALPVRVRNPATSGQPCTLFDVSTVGAGFALKTPVASGTVLQPGEDRTLMVEARSPGAAGALTGALEVQSSRTPDSVQSVALAAEVGSSCVSFVPSWLDFGDVPAGCQVERVVTAINRCTTGKLFEALELTTGLSTAYSLVSKPVIPYSLSGGSQHAFTVRYAPQSDPDVQSLAASINPQTTKERTWITGRKGTGSTHVDTFTVARKIDVLFVVDDSMFVKTQGGIAAAMGSFVQEGAGVDYQVGVAGLTADDFCSLTPPSACGYPNGALLTGSRLQWQTGTRVLLPSPTLAAEIATRFDMQYIGSPDEMPLRGAYLALDHNPYNAGFVRPDARLEVVFVTDAEDRSPSWITLQTFTPLLPHDRLRFWGFVPLEASTINVGQKFPTCAGYDTSSSFPATRLPNVIAQSGGKSWEVCDPDWSAHLSELGKEIFQSEAFRLRLKPDASGLTVRVGGVQVPEVSSAGARNWSYDSATGALLLTMDPFPVNGTPVEVDYAPVCSP